MPDRNPSKQVFIIVPVTIFNEAAKVSEKHQADHDTPKTFDANTADMLVRRGLAITPEKMAERRKNKKAGAGVQAPIGPKPRKTKPQTESASE